jgi:hypothetical protein
MSYVYGGVAVLLLSMTLGGLFHLRWAHRLPALPDGQPALDQDRLRCSIVLAARNEEARIEKAIRQLLGQIGVEVDVIAVDDRSTDGTSGILQRLAAEDPRLRVKRIDTLPADWLGKCHACHLGASLATGEWILFTDADCCLKPDVIARALRAAALEEADHIALTPGVAPESIPGQAWHLAFLISLANWLSGVNRDKPRAYLGIGAFNLVRAALYHKSGGYEALRLTVLDDIKFGLLVRRAGGRTRAFIGGDDVECHWGGTARGMIKIMEKNYFAAVEYRTSAALTVGIGGPLLWCIAALGPLTGTLSGLAAGVALVSLVWPAMIVARRLRWSLGPAALVPFIYPLLFYAVLNSALVTLRQGGIRWRETFYPLAALRAGRLR